MDIHRYFTSISQSRGSLNLIGAELGIGRGKIEIVTDKECNFLVKSYNISVHVLRGRRFRKIWPSFKIAEPDGVLHQIKNLNKWSSHSIEYNTDISQLLRVITGRPIHA
jgi:hypothetical protein